MALGGKIRLRGCCPKVDVRALGLLALLLTAVWANAQSVLVQPGSLFFRNPTGTNFTQQVAVTSSNGPLGTVLATVSYTIAGNPAWLTGTPVVDPGTGQVTGLAVQVSPGSLPPGLYTGQITVSAGNHSPAVVKVSLTLIPVTQGFPANALILTPDTLTFQATQGGGSTALPPVAIYNPSGEQYSWTATSPVPWLTLTASSATITPGSLALSVTGAGDAALQLTASALNQSAGTHTATVTVTSGSVTSKIAVTMVVQPSQPATIGVSPATLAFESNSSITQRQAFLQVLNTGGAALNWTAKASTDSINGVSGWLTISPSSGKSVAGSQDAGSIQVTVKTTGLPAGLYTGAITISAGNNQTVVPVYLRAANRLATVIPQEMVFTVSPGSATQQSNTVTLYSSTSGAFTVTPSFASGGNWFTVNPLVGSQQTAGTIVTATLVPSVINALAAGVYYGQIQFATTGTGQQSNIVRVVLNVRAPTDPVHLDVDQGGLIFGVAPGLGIGNSVVVTVSLPGGSTSGTPVSAITSTTNGGNFLTVTPTAGSVTPSKPLQFTVTVSAIGLLQGVYTGRVIFTAGTTSTPVSVYVEMVVGNTNAPPVAAGPLSAAFLTPADEFITRADVPTGVTAKVLDSNGVAVTGALVQVKSSNGEPPLLLQDVGGGTYIGVFHPLSSGTLALSGTAVYSGANGVQTAPAFMVSGQMAPAKGALTAIYPGGVVSAASYAPAPAPISAGSLVSIFGAGIAGTGGFSSSFPLPAQLGGTSVMIGGLPAPMIAAVPSLAGDQVNVQVPFELEGLSVAEVSVTTNGVITSVEDVIVGNAPAVFTTNETGAGPVVAAGAAALHSNYTPISASNPATGNEVILIYATGLGPVTPAASTGAAAGVASTINVPVVKIGSQNANVEFAGLAPGFAGLYQINVDLPSGAGTGAVPISITVNGVALTNATPPTIYVQ